MTDNQSPKYERMSATPDPHNQRIFVAWGVGLVSGTLDLTAAEAIAIGDAGHALKAAAEEQPTAPAPPPGSYWTDLSGKVWDLSCQYLDRHHRLWRVNLISGDVVMNRPKDGRGYWWPLAHVQSEYGPLVAIPPKAELAQNDTSSTSGCTAEVSDHSCTCLTGETTLSKVEVTHYGNGTHGGLAPHNGKRQNCPAPECVEAEDDQRAEDASAPTSPAGIVRRAAATLKCDVDKRPFTVGGHDHVWQTLAAEAWEHQADDMADYLGRFRTPAGYHGYAVHDGRDTYRPDWTATVCAALAYLGEPAPSSEGTAADKPCTCYPRCAAEG